MEKEFLNPPDLPNWQRTFSQVAVVRSGAFRIIWVAGQVSVDEKKNLIGEGDLETQTKQAFRNWAAGVRFANGGRQLGVESLAEEGFLIEVDAVAVAQ